MFVRDTAAHLRESEEFESFNNQTKKWLHGLVHCQLSGREYFDDMNTFFKNNPAQEKWVNDRRQLRQGKVEEGFTTRRPHKKAIDMQIAVGYAFRKPKNGQNTTSYTGKRSNQNNQRGSDTGTRSNGNQNNPKYVRMTGTSSTGNQNNQNASNRHR